jgi:hypothetical protein
MKPWFVWLTTHGCILAQDNAGEQKTTTDMDIPSFRSEDHYRRFTFVMKQSDMLHTSSLTQPQRRREPRRTTKVTKIICYKACLKIMYRCLITIHNIDDPEASNTSK